MRSQLGAVAIGLVGSLSPVLGVADSAAALVVHVLAVRATENGPSDPELASLRPHLRRLAGYRSFRMVQDEKRACPWRNDTSFALPGGRSLLLVPKGMEDEAVAMQVRLLDGRRRLMDTQVRLRNHGTMVFGVGRDARSGAGALLILLRVEEE